MRDLETIRNEIKAETENKNFKRVIELLNEERQVLKANSEVMLKEFERTCNGK